MIYEITVVAFKLDRISKVCYPIFPPVFLWLNTNKTARWKVPCKKNLRGLDQQLFATRRLHPSSSCRENHPFFEERQVRSWPSSLIKHCSEFVVLFFSNAHARRLDNRFAYAPVSLPPKWEKRRLRLLPSRTGKKSRSISKYNSIFSKRDLMLQLSSLNNDEGVKNFFVPLRTVQGRGCTAVAGCTLLADEKCVLLMYSKQNKLERLICSRNVLLRKQKRFEKWEFPTNILIFKL